VYDLCLFFEWFYGDGITNGEFTAGKDKTAYPTPPFQRVPCPRANRLLHARARIARGFDKDVHLSDAEPLPNHIIKIDPPDHDLASARPGGDGNSQEMFDRRQCFGFDQRELSTTIPM
jgi:hypothetical protein